MKFYSQGLTPFVAHKTEDKWEVVLKESKEIVIRSGIDERAAKRLANYLNEKVNVTITDCCIGGCYLCDS